MKKADNRQWQIICLGAPLISTNSSTVHYTSHSTCIQTNTSTGICLSTVKQNKPRITHTAKRSISTLASFLHGIWGETTRSHRDSRHVHIWQRCKHGDIWFVLQVQSALWDTQTSALKTGRKCRTLPVRPSWTNWHHQDASRRLHIRKWGNVRRNKKADKYKHT